MNAWNRVAFACFACFAGCALLFAPLVVTAAPPVSVTSATPSYAYQGTTLDVVVAGSGFDSTASVKYYVTGTTSPGGITVKKVTFKSPRQLVTTLEVADSAVLDYFDIEVTLDSGRKGKGTTLFSVKAKSAVTDTYDGQNLGTLPGDKHSDAWDVNASGNVVGRSYSSATRAFYWSGSMYQLPVSTDASNTPPYTVAWDAEATGISNGPSEMAVGFEQRTVCESKTGPCSAEQHPVYWSGDLTTGPAAVRLDGAYGSAHGTNPAGDMVVGFGGYGAGAFWSRQGSGWVRSNIPLTSFGCQGCEYESGAAWNVNDAGIIVGAVTRKGDYQQFAYVYDTQTATGTILPLPPGYLQSGAYAIGNTMNGSVQVAGVVEPCTDMPCDGSLGIRWTVNVTNLQASFEILNQMAWAEGVTDQGYVAGTHNSASNRRGSITQTATLWKQLYGYFTLKPPGGSDSTTRGMAAGSDGTVFVVGETNSKGAWTAARWVIP